MLYSWYLYISWLYVFITFCQSKRTRHHKVEYIQLILNLWSLILIDSMTYSIICDQYLISSVLRAHSWYTIWWNTHYTVRCSVNPALTNQTDQPGAYNILVHGFSGHFPDILSRYLSKYFVNPQVRNQIIVIDLQLIEVAKTKVISTNVYRQ
jgi:hypothetical protein